MQRNVVPLWFLGSVLGYIVILLILIPISGLTATALSIFPVILVSWHFGLRPAILAGCVAPLLHLLLIFTLTDFEWQSTLEQGGLITVIVVLAGVTIGKLRDEERAFSQQMGEPTPKQQKTRPAIHHHKMLGPQSDNEPVFQFQERLWALQEVSLELSRAETLKLLCQHAIELGRQRLGFDRLGIWLVDDTDPNYMLGAYGTDEHGQLRDEWGIRVAVPQSKAIREILNGQIRFHLWDEAPLYNHQQEVVGTGWIAMTVLWGDDRGMGWLSADNLIDQQPASPNQLELLYLYGSTLGHLLKRKQAEAALQVFQEQLKTLQKVGFQLSRAETLRTLCRQAVELGRSELGFDRLGIWLVDNSDPDFMLGAYGTDEQGHLRDEWGVRLPIAPAEAVHEMLSGKTPYFLWQDAKLYNHQQEVVGHGWSAMTVLWGDDRGMGWLSADNLIHRQPMSPQQMELLHLYGSTLGHLIRRKQVEEDLREFLEKLKALQIVSLELSKADTFANLCRQAIELGQSRLGFDRLSIWLVDEGDPSYMFGAYGTDEHGQLRDEQSVHIELPQTEAFREVLSGKIPHYIWENTPLHNHRHEVVGQGWNATTVLWGDDRGIGWLSADNLIRQEPATPQRLELLSLFGSTLGHLIRRKRTEEALRASEARFRALYRDNPSMFFTLDAAGIIVSVNEFGATQLGYTVEALEGQSVLQVFFEEDQAALKAHLERCLQNPDKIFQRELRKVRKDGSLLWVEEFARALLSPTNELQVLIVCQDVSERKAAEQHQLELAVEREKVGFLQDFLGSMAHDLKTPTAGIEMNLAILNSLYESEDAQPWLELIHKQLENLTGIINDVLTIARLETLPDLSFENVNINQLVQDIKTSLDSRFDSKNLTLTLALDDSLPAIYGCRDELYRAFLNLFENAIKYTPEQGRVSIKTCGLNGQVITEITDTGIGISEGHLSRIFDEFYRADNARSFTNGTGLGLAITKKIIDLHQGTIAVNSVLGEGTTFQVNLPALH